eukprot:jgi/Chrzof1/3067/Cz12g10150.t1
MAAYTVLALQVLQTLLPPAWHYQHTNIHQSGERRQGFQPCRIQHMQAVASGIIIPLKTIAGPIPLKHSVVIIETTTQKTHKKT